MVEAYGDKGETLFRKESGAYLAVLKVQDRGFFFIEDRLPEHIHGLGEDHLHKGVVYLLDSLVNTLGKHDLLAVHAVMDAADLDHLTVEDSISYCCHLAAVRAVLVGVAVAQLFTLGRGGGLYLPAVLDVIVFLQILQREPHRFHYITSVTKLVGRTERIYMDVGGRYAVDGHQVFRHGIVGYIGRDHIIARRVVVHTKPADTGEQGVEDSLMYVGFYVGQAHPGVGCAFEDIAYASALTLVIFYGEEELGVVEGYRGNGLLDNLIEHRHPHCLGIIYVPDLLGIAQIVAV